MSPSNRSVMSPSDPNYHRWLAKRHQAAAGDAAGTGSSDEAQAAALHHSNSYNQRLLQAHKLLMEQSQRARESRNQDRHSESELNSARDAPREQRDYGGYEYSQSVPPPSMTVDVGSRYPNHSSSAYPQTPNQPGGHGLFSPPAHGGNSGGLFSPPAHGSNYSPRQQSQHQHLNPLFSPLPSSTPSGGAHSGLSIGLHHPPASHHSYLMTSPTPSGGSGADGSMQGQHDAYGGSTMQHDSYGSSGFNLPTPMQTSRGVSSLLPSGTGSPSIHGQPNSFLFTPLPPQTPSVFMNLSSHATTGSGVVNGGNGAGVGGAGRQNAPSGNVTMQGNETPLPAGASTNMANYGTQFDWGHTTMRGSPRHQPSANTNSVSTPPPQRFTMSPHVRGSDILGMLSPGGVNGLSAMPISPMMESSLPMLPTVHDIAS